MADVRYRSCLSDFLPCCKEKGLGTVIMGIFDEDKITELLEIPEERELAALIAVGWPDIDPEVPKERAWMIYYSSDKIYILQFYNTRRFPDETFDKPT